MKKKLLKLTLTFLILFQFNSFLNAESNIIYPLKKPILKENKTKTKAGNYLVPIKKPIKKKINEDLNVVKKTTVSGEILPKSKPLIVKTKKTPKVTKSKYYSKKDFSFAKKSIQLMEQKKWKSAEKSALKAKDKSIYNFIRWNHLLTTGNTLTFVDYKRFIEAKPRYPRINRIKYLAEHKMSTKNLSANNIIQWFEKYPPFSGFGSIILGEAHLLKGNSQKGKELIKDGWITADLTRSEMKFYSKKFKKILNSSDYIKRADYLAYENKYWDLKRMLRYLPKDYQLLYTARQLLMSRSYGVDTAISKVPQKLKNNHGLNYDRLKWRR